MKRFIAFSTALVLSAALITGGAAAQSPFNTKNGWFPRAKYGFEDTYAYGRTAGQSNGYDETIDSLGNLPPNLDSLVNSFDAVKYANDCATFGFDYVEFTAWHADQNLLYPSRVMDSVRGPGHSAKRDIIQPLADALHARGIKFILYVHPADGHDMSLPEQILLGWNSAAGVAAATNTKWMNFQYAIMRELCARYTTSVDGYFFDGLWAHHNPEIGGWVPPDSFGAIIHQYNPNAVVIDNNMGVNAACEYNTDERYPPTTDITTYNCSTDQVQLLLGDSWWSTHPLSAGNITRFSAENIFRWTIFQGGCSRSGGMVWGEGSYWKGGWEGGVRAAFTKVGNYISPISESIRNTYPSTSFILSSGILYSAMPHGIVALKSSDNLSEYIHVLKPPSGATLDLPVPVDGKAFTSASILRPTGRTVTLTQNTSGVHLTLSGAWDTLNTVIKLTVDPTSIHINLAYCKPVTASSNVGGSWDKNDAVDGLRTSGGSSMGWSSMNSLTTNHTEWILVDLDSIFLVEKIDLYPRNDGVNAGYGFPANFTIQVSIDSASWTTVVTRTGYPLPTGTLQSFPITPVNARYIKVTGTSLRANPNDMNQYRMQFAEIEVYGQYLTAVHPDASVPLRQVYAQEIFKTTLSRFMLPPGFASRPVAVLVYDLRGHCLKQKQVNGETIDLRKDFGIAEGVYIIKVKTQ